MWKEIKDHPWVLAHNEDGKLSEGKIAQRFFTQNKWPLLALEVHKSLYPGDEGYKISCNIKFNEDDVWEPYGIPSNLFKTVYEMLQEVRKKPVLICTGLLGGTKECGQKMPCVFHG